MRNDPVSMGVAAPDIPSVSAARRKRTIQIMANG